MGEQQTQRVCDQPLAPHGLFAVIQAAWAADNRAVQPVACKPLLEELFFLGYSSAA
ncbi:MAG: hypothetical protein LBC67_06750 [Spirochaetales bacterium]|nr:hypothetical protein [Spirochaetales bacterium]